MYTNQFRFLFLNIGHFLDHFFVLIFATVALHLTTTWDMSYAELIPYATPGFVAFGLGSIPAGWLADKWSREGMLVVFFLGMGISSVFASTADTPLELLLFLTLLGLFAAIYTPSVLQWWWSGSIKPVYQSLLMEYLEIWELPALLWSLAYW